MTSVPQWKLRRLASRAIRVLNRKIEEGSVFKAYEYSLLPVAQQYIKDYDNISKYNVTLFKEKKESVTAARNLFETTRVWLPLLKRDVKGFSAQNYSNTMVNDDILEDGNRLFDFITDYVDPTGNKLPYADDCLANMEPVLHSALKEISEGEQADLTYQAMAKATRDNGERLQKELVAFRKTIAYFSGRNDKDFQKLRLSKSHIPDTDDDQNAPTSPTITPANPGDTPVL
jgi:hypothetical protein